jgi:hypothetical protein
MWLQPQTRLEALFWARVTVSFYLLLINEYLELFYKLNRKHGPVKFSLKHP